MENELKICKNECARLEKLYDEPSTTVSIQLTDNIMIIDMIG